MDYTALLYYFDKMPYFLNFAKVLFSVTDKTYNKAVIMKFLINTKAVGYKGQDKTEVNLTYQLKTVKDQFLADLLGDTYTTVQFETFDVQGLEILAKNFILEGLTEQDATDLTLKHLKNMVKDYILFDFNKPYSLVSKA